MIYKLSQLNPRNAVEDALSACNIAAEQVTILADAFVFSYNQLAELDYSSLMQAETLSEAQRLLDAVYKREIAKQAKYAAIFADGLYAKAEKTFTHAGTHNKNVTADDYSNINTNAGSENSPIGRSYSTTITTPNLLQKGSTTDTRDHSSTEDGEDNYTNTEHNPLEDLRIIREGGLSWFDICDKIIIAWTLESVEVY